VFDDDVLSRIGRVRRVVPFGDVDDATMNADGMALVDASRKMLARIGRAASYGPRALAAMLARGDIFILQQGRHSHWLATARSGKIRSFISRPSAHGEASVVFGFARNRRLRPARDADDSSKLETTPSRKSSLQAAHAGASSIRRRRVRIRMYLFRRREARVEVAALPPAA
jgi:hypothetical protein